MHLKSVALIFKEIPLVKTRQRCLRQDPSMKPRLVLKFGLGFPYQNHKISLMHLSLPSFFLILDNELGL